MMNDAKVVYNDVHGSENQQQHVVPRDCDISSVMSRPVAPASIAGGGCGGGVKWRDQREVGQIFFLVFVFFSFFGFF